MNVADRLAALDARIEAMSLDLSAIDAPIVRLLAPVLRGLGIIDVSVRVERLDALLTAKASGEADAQQLVDLAEQALEEHEAAIDSVERAMLVRGRVLVAHAAWLRRVFDVLSRALEESEVLDPGEGGTSAFAAHHQALDSAERFRLLQPLWLEDQARPGVEPNPALAVELGAVDVLIGAAHSERRMLRRRRALLEAARQRLLEASAALHLEVDKVEARRSYIAREIVRLDRLQAAGLDGEVDLLHQARTALTRGNLGQLHAALVALDEHARVANDRARCVPAGRALRTFCRHIGYTEAELGSPEARRVSLLRSGQEQLGADVLRRFEAAYERARATAASAVAEMPPPARAAALRSLGGEAIPETIASILAADGAFEVGGTLCPVRAEEIELRARAVAFPTATMELTPARRPEDLTHAVIQDPRRVVLDLAAGRLLARTFLTHEPERIVRNRACGEVRVYVLDASGSMNGPRARMRDAMLLSELMTLMRRLETHGRAARVVLYYRFFTLELTPVVRVADRNAALAAIDDVLGTLRGGGTDIHTALLASIQQIHEARASDPDLGRAQIVLVTDGEAPVVEEAIQQARRGLEDFPIAVSVVALGEENDALRTLVAQQRARGERAFYHFIPDSALAATMLGAVDSGCALHVTPKNAVDLGALRHELGGLLDEVMALDRRQDLEAMERLDAERRACSELGLSGDEARLEATQRDLRNLERRFLHWFPPPDTTASVEDPSQYAVLASRRGAPSSMNARGEPTAQDLDAEAVLVVLDTIAEVVSTVGGSPLQRRADAIELLERLLPDGGLTAGRYRDVVMTASHTLDTALAGVHRAVGGVGPITPARTATIDRGQL